MDIVDWRARIDVIDAELIALLSERARCSQRIGAWKRTNGQAIHDAERETALIQELTAKNVGPLSSAQVQRIFGEILAVSRELQEQG